MQCRDNIFNRHTHRAARSSAGAAIQVALATFDLARLRFDFFACKLDPRAPLGSSIYLGSSFGTSVPHLVPRFELLSLIVSPSGLSADSKSISDFRFSQFVHTLCPRRSEGNGDRIVAPTCHLLEYRSCYMCIELIVPGGSSSPFTCCHTWGL